jgi:hypothetical protein
VIATNPMEITKIRMQMQALLPEVERQTTMQVVRQMGIKGKYIVTSYYLFCICIYFYLFVSISILNLSYLFCFIFNLRYDYK